MPAPAAPAAAAAPLGAVPMPVGGGATGPAGSGPAPSRARAAGPAAPASPAPKRAAPRTASGGRGARGGPAQPATESGGPVTGGAPELDSWKAAVKASSDKVVPRTSDHQAPDALAGEAKAKEDERVRLGRTSPPTPAASCPRAQAARAVEQLDTKAADAALASVDAAGRVRISNQQFPPMVPMPAGLAPPVPACRPRVCPSRRQRLGGWPARPNPDPNAGRSRQIAAAGPVAAGKGPAAGGLLSDPGPASLEPLPPGAGDPHRRRRGARAGRGAGLCAPDRRRGERHPRPRGRPVRRSPDQKCSPTSRPG